MHNRIYEVGQPDKPAPTQWVSNPTVRPWQEGQLAATFPPDKSVL